MFLDLLVFRGDRMITEALTGQISGWVQGKGKGKAVPLQFWGGPDCSRKLRFPDFMTTARDGGKGGKVVSLTHRSPFLTYSTVQSPS